MDNIIKNMAPFISWPHMTIDADAIATGMLKMTESLPEEYQNALAIGMLPAPLMDILNKTLTDKIKTECCKSFDLPETTEYKDLFELPKNKFNAIMHEVTTNMLKKRKHAIQ